MRQQADSQVSATSKIIRLHFLLFGVPKDEPIKPPTEERDAAEKKKFTKSNLAVALITSFFGIMIILSQTSVCDLPS